MVIIVQRIWHTFDMDPLKDNYCVPYVFEYPTVIYVYNNNNISLLPQSTY